MITYVCGELVNYESECKVRGTLSEYSQETKLSGHLTGIENSGVIITTLPYKVDNHVTSMTWRFEMTHGNNEIDYVIMLLRRSRTHRL